MATKVGSITLDGKTYVILLGTAVVAGGIALTLLPEQLSTDESAKRKAVVDAAASQVGLSDKSVYCKVACRSQDHYNWPRDWCGIFALWAYIVAGLNVTWRWGDPKSWFSYKLSTTTDPKIGDTAYFDHNQHHAIIERIDGDDIHLINGNGAGGKVTRSVVKRSQVTAFYSIGRIL